MTTKRVLATIAFAFIAASAGASGFGLYEPTAKYHAMGGAVVGRAVDASANFANPATLTDLTNIEVTVGFVTEHPRGDVRVNGHTYEMDPGAFMLPHLMTAVPLPWGFTFGLGISPEYGLGTEFSDSWAMNWSTVETTVQGIVINPNLAYKITDKWSIGVGLRWLYFDFEQDAYPWAAKDGKKYGQLDNHLHGDNGWENFGWQIGTKYDILDNLSAGLVYKSAIDDIKVKGHTRTTVKSYDYSSIPSGLPAAYQMAYQQQIRQQVDEAAKSRTGGAEAELTLPQAIIGGVNWDVTEKWHLGTSLSWTEWSEIDTLHFMLCGEDNPRKLGWHDTWRASVGTAYDFLEDWTFMMSYVYDMDCTSKHQTSAMLPPADRHILGGGISWRCWGGLELTLSYSCIFMDGGVMRTSDSLGNEYTLKTKEGFCHAAGFSVTYRF